MKDRRNRWESCLHMLTPETMQVKTTCPRAYKKDGTLYTDKESCKTCKAWKGWECKTRREILMIVAKDCSKCFYGSCVMNGDKSTCEYLAVTGHKRPCKPGDCRETGVFEPKKKGRRKQIRL